MLITNLELRIAQNDKHGIFTGTFDPPHLGHVKAIAEAFRQIDLSSVIAIPHNWTNEKKPVSLEIRTQWLIATLRELIPDLTDKIAVCCDLSIAENPNEFDRLCNIYGNRIYRIIGSDKEVDKIKKRNGAQALLTQRVPNISSGMIKAAIQEGRIDDIRKIMAKKVLQEILENKHYRQTT